MAFFYLSALVAAGFSNILGWAFSLLDGAHGIEGWRSVHLALKCAADPNADHATGRADGSSSSLRQ